jgi:hypothetical protein
VHVNPDRQKQAHGEWNAEDIVYAGPDHIPLDDPKDTSRKMESGDNVEEVATHENYIGCLDGD